MEKQTTRIRNAPLTRQLSFSSAIAAIYAILVALLPATSVPIIQVRVADVLMPLSILFGWPAIVGVTLGAGIGNFAADSVFGLTGASIGVDVVGGSLANLIAATAAWQIAHRAYSLRGKRISWLIAVNAETVIVTLTVGAYLGWLFSTPLWVSMAGILAGSVVAISIGGYAVLRVLGRPRTLDALASTELLANVSISTKK